MKLKSLLLIALLYTPISRAQSTSSSRQIFTVITPVTKEMTLEKRSALRVLLNHQEGCTITGYRAADQSFYITSTDDKAAAAMQNEIQRSYPEVNVTRTGKANYEALGFTQIAGRTILQKKDYPVYIITGDNQLDEFSYSLEKEMWTKQHPTESK